MAATETVERYRLVASAEGVNETVAATRRLATATDGASASADRSTAASDKATRARLSMADGLARAARTQEAQLRMNDALGAASRELERGFQREIESLRQRGTLNDNLAQSQGRLADATRGAADDQVRSLGAVGSAFREAGRFAAAHPVLVAAGSVVAARSLSGLATTAAGSLGRASAATAAYGAEAAAMGSRVAGAAGIAAAGLKFGEGAALSAAGGLAAYADKVQNVTATTGLLARGLGALAPLLGPIAVAFLAFEVGRAVLGKASSDLDKLVQLGQRAEKLDVSGPFLRGFEELGPKLRIATAEMEKLLQTASGFVQDKLGQQNQLVSYLATRRGEGYTSDGLRAAEQQADLAKTTEERIRAAVVAMRELEAAGYKFAAIDLAQSVFGPEVADRLRQNQTTAAQLGQDLDEAARKQVVKAEDVTRALEQARAIEDVKREITEAWRVSFDFSNVSYAINEAWLGVLKTVRDVGQAIQNAAAWAEGLMTKLGNAEIWNKLYRGMDKLGLTGMGGLEAVLAEGRDEAAKWPGRVQADSSGRAMPYQFNEHINAYLKSLKETATASRGAGAATREMADAFDNAMQRTRDQTDELRLQADMAGKNTLEVYKLTEANKLWRAARQAGRADEAGMAEKIDDVSAAYARQRVATERALEAQRAMQDGQRELGRTFTTFVEDLITGSGKVTQAFASIGKTFLSGGLQALLTGQGAFAGMMGLAPAEKGGMGGLLGMSAGQFKSLISEGTTAGVTGALQGPTQSGATLDTFGGVGGLSGGRLMSGIGGLMALAGSYGMGTQSGSRGQALIGGSLAGGVTGFNIETVPAQEAA